MTLQISLDPATITALEGLLSQVQAIAAPSNAAQLDRIERKLDALAQQETNIMAAIDDLTAEVTRDTTVIDSATTLIKGFGAQLAAAGTDPAKLAALQNTLKTNVDSLAAAVAANTPAAPPAV